MIRLVLHEGSPYNVCRAPQIAQSSYRQGGLYNLWDSEELLHCADATLSFHGWARVVQHGGLFGQPLTDGMVQRESRPGHDTGASFDNEADSCLVAAIQDAGVSTWNLRFGEHR